MPAASGEYPPSARRVPAEWEARAGTLLAWPPEHSSFADDPRVLATLRELVALLREREPVCVIASPDERGEIAAELGGEGESLRIEPLLINDVWMRDAGPISALETGPGGAEEAVFVDGGFNGWGGKYPHEMDRLVPTILARRWGVRRARTGAALEGGAIEPNGAGDVLTTESVLLNPNRGNADKSAVEAALRRDLGAERVHWLGQGLAGDDTDGHIDNLARFTAPGHVVCPSPELPAGHPDAPALRENRRILESMDTATGRAQVVEMPVPEVTGRRGERLPASYANFYLAPDLVIAPIFGDNGDDRALGILRELFPSRRVEGLDARPLLAEGGAIHCLAQPLQRIGGAP